MTHREVTADPNATGAREAIRKEEPVAGISHSGEANGKEEKEREERVEGEKRKREGGRNSSPDTCGNLKTVGAVFF